MQPHTQTHVGSRLMPLCKKYVSTCDGRGRLERVHTTVLARPGSGYKVRIRIRIGNEEGVRVRVRVRGAGEGAGEGRG